MFIYVSVLFDGAPATLQFPLRARPERPKFRLWGYSLSLKKYNTPRVFAHPTTLSSTGRNGGQAGHQCVHTVNYARHTLGGLPAAREQNNKRCDPLLNGSQVLFCGANQMTRP